MFPGRDVLHTHTVVGLNLDHNHHFTAIFVVTSHGVSSNTVSISLEEKKKQKTTKHVEKNIIGLTPFPFEGKSDTV